MSVSPTRWRRRVVVLALLVIITWIVLPRLLQVNPWASLRSLNRPLLWLALLAQGGTQCARGLLLRRVTAGHGPAMRRRHAILIMLAASSIGLVGGGFPGYAAALYRWIRARELPVAAAVLAGWMPSLLHSGAVAVVAIGASTMLLISGLVSPTEEAGLLAGMLPLLISVVAAAWIMRDRERVARCSLAGARLWARLRHRVFDEEASRGIFDRFDEAWRGMRQRGWWALLMTALLSVVCDALSVWAVLAAAGQPLSFPIVCAAWGIPQLLGSASMLPGGAGVVELTMTPLLERFGVAVGPALAVVLAYRALAFWLPMLAGLPIIVWLEHRT